MRICRAWGLWGIGLLISFAARAATINQIGAYDAWPTEWSPMLYLSDPDDGLARSQIDFVGDDADPGVYIATDDNYLYFRIRVNVGTVASDTFRDSHIILVDVAGSQYNTTTRQLESGADDGMPDYAFAWDSKSNDPTKHGLEMLVRSTINTYWNGINMNDLDGDAGKKLANDINGAGRTTDGYVRTVDQVETANFSMSSCIDMAVSRAYLNTYTGLRSDQTWNFALGSIANSTDHNNLTGDIAGGADPASLASTGWAVLPEPGSAALWIVAGFGIACCRMVRRRHRLIQTMCVD